MDDTTAGLTQARLLTEAMNRDHLTLQALWSGYRGQGGTVEQFEIEAHHQPRLPYTRDLLHGGDTTPEE